MGKDILRRDFLKGAPAAGLLTQAVLTSVPSSAATATEPPATFQYQGTRLRDSRWQKQYRTARDYYLTVSNDDILQGFRAAGLTAPGKPLGGWCARAGSTVFGQWLSGMARISKVAGATAIHDKASLPVAEWDKTIKREGDCRMRHYPYEEPVCGLVDMRVYGANKDALPLLEKVTDFAAGNFNRDRVTQL